MVEIQLLIASDKLCGFIENTPSNDNVGNTQIKIKQLKW
jgi:hypothetical protein